VLVTADPIWLFVSVAAPSYLRLCGGRCKRCWFDLTKSLAANHQMNTLCLRTIKAGMAYFFLAFGAGFVMGTIRIPFLVPRLGERVAELIEIPFMFIVIVLAARFITKRFALPLQSWSV